jgi:hypothetical protein
MLVFIFLVVIAIVIFLFKEKTCNFFKTVWLDKYYLLGIVLVITLISIIIYDYFGENITYMINKSSDYEDFMTNRNINIFKNDVITTANQADNFIVHLGYIGDYISGTIGVGISVITLLIVFLTFYAEKKKNQKQRFEDHFFHLLSIHRDNVKTMKIEHKSFDFRVDYGGCYESHKAILKMFRELMEMIKLIAKNDDNQEIKEVNKRAALVYLCFYFGFGGRSGHILNTYLKEYTDSVKNILESSFKDNKDLRKELELFEKQYLKLTKINLVSRRILNVKIDNVYAKMLRKELTEDADLKYKAAGGHQTRLDHYFANLLFCFELIQEQKKYMLEMDIDIYKKELMSQLNVYEKILLLIHSASPIGEEFQRYIVEYDIKKYIPDGMIKEKEFDIEDYFSQLKIKYKKK